MFGRRIFEAFANEFAVTHLNENSELKKLSDIIAEKEAEIEEKAKAIEESTSLVESKEREIQVIKESAERKDTLNELLGTLNKEKAAVMSDLLESIQTEKLRSAYDKYLPAVLNASVKPKADKPVLAESKEVTGNKESAKSDVETPEDNNVVELKRLAGLK
jgi:hypothetical protein